MPTPPPRAAPHPPCCGTGAADACWACVPPPPTPPCSLLSRLCPAPPRPPCLMVPLRCGVALLLLLLPRMRSAWHGAQRRSLGWQGPRRRCLLLLLLRLLVRGTAMRGEASDGGRRELKSLVSADGWRGVMQECSSVTWAQRE
eukprot:1157653-Pelagomonas_calceolata.AAC.1